MARFAKKGSTRTDILEAMFKELKKDGAEYYLGGAVIYDPTGESWSVEIKEGDR